MYGYEVARCRRACSPSGSGPKTSGYTRCRKAMAVTSTRCTGPHPGQCLSGKLPSVGCDVIAVFKQPVPADIPIQRLCAGGRPSRVPGVCFRNAQRRDPHRPGLWSTNDRPVQLRQPLTLLHLALASRQVLGPRVHQVNLDPLPFQNFHKPRSSTLRWAAGPPCGLGIASARPTCAAGRRSRTRFPVPAVRPGRMARNKVTRITDIDPPCIRMRHLQTRIG
jgi:hypothetical protein